MDVFHQLQASVVVFVKYDVIIVHKKRLKSE